MDYVLSDFLGKICVVCIDDNIIFSRSHQEHKYHLRMILDWLDAAGLTLSNENLMLFKSWHSPQQYRQYDTS